ncbi:MULTISPECIES: hypothetical protein [unclassified Chryseobacterium]|uniref:hypothetical protein n=1 Tax=unclassified Chryseobacterium TaxID=2593645 RepID=UPI001158EA7F|nr:hypothetical protein [Chryseobacterium sp. ON_d1]
MRQFLVLAAVVMTAYGYGQTNCDALKKDNETLQSTNKVLTSENEYLKKVLDLNKPILESEQENSTYTITAVKGNKAGKTIEITFLIESKDENHRRNSGITARSNSLLMISS